MRSRFLLCLIAALIFCSSLSLVTAQEGGSAEKEALAARISAMLEEIHAAELRLHAAELEIRGLLKRAMEGGGGPLPHPDPTPDPDPHPTPDPDPPVDPTPDPVPPVDPDPMPPVDPDPVPPTGGTDPAMVSSVTRHGISWVFSQPTRVAFSLTGAPMVEVGTVVESIVPGVGGGGGERVLNGSMWDPTPRRGLNQGYDSSMYAKYKFRGSYSSELNVGLLLPFVMRDGSLVSTDSVDAANQRPQIDKAAVLSAVPQLPQSGTSFRPAVSGYDVIHNSSEIRWDALAQLKPAVGMPSLDRIVQDVERLWLDHGTGWAVRYMHPDANMNDYGREITVSMGTALLAANCDHGPELEPLRRQLVYELIQKGIDYYGWALDALQSERFKADYLTAVQGHGNGRKMVLLFASALLGNADMARVARDLPFSEDAQTFYVQPSDVGTRGFKSTDVGLPEWGGYHSWRPEQDDARWAGNPYRRCCTWNAIWGHAAAALSMGLREEWGHEPFFDYTARYRTREVQYLKSTNDSQTFTLAWGEARWALEMYDAVVSGAPGQVPE